MTEPGFLSAGRFSQWLRSTRTAQAQDSGAEVPCGDCNACCRSSYFIHVRPEEARTLTRIPEELLFAAPGLPEGNVLLGYDENGRCPMLRDDECSIYEDRPLTCRNYDCRVFTAAGIAADRVLIAERALRWQFSYPATDDHNQHSAVRAAASFLEGHRECFPGGTAPDSPAQVAILAVKVYDVFLKHNVDSVESGRVPSDLEVAKAVVEASEKFEAGRGTAGK